MIPQGFGYHQRSSDHHWMLACVAVLLSAVVHVLIMYWFADWRLSTVGVGIRKEWEYGLNRVPPMRVETLKTDPLLVSNKQPGERDQPSRGPIEVNEQVKVLSQETPPALVTPQPVPQSALSVQTEVRATAKQVDTAPWVPRQEIRQIFERKIQEEVAALPRRELPVIERVPQALDIVPSIDLAGRRFSHESEPPRPIPAAEVFDTEIQRGTLAIEMPEGISRDATLARFGSPKGGLAGQMAVQKPEIPEPVPPSPEKHDTRDAIEKQAQRAQNAIESMRETVEYVPIDDLLGASVEVYRDPKEIGKLYFRVWIQPRADKVIPVIEKDVIWVLDVSGSMTEERLTFCRRAMTAALQTLNPKDRFTILAFRDTVMYGSPSWMPVDEASIGKAATFIAGMRAFGYTDVLGSLNALVALPRDPVRPMVAFIVTDGKPTTGMTESASIIGAFSKLNSGMISVYMYGTHKSANAYLLDMLTYCNRGTSSVITGNRWDIPTTMATMYEGFRHPVMSDVSVMFDALSKSETYPRRTTNLYKDRPIEVVGVCSDHAQELIFQVCGLAGAKGYDSIFRLKVSEARTGTAEVKSRWAHQKMFHYAARYSRDPRNRVDAMQVMRQIHTQYDVEIPYPHDLKE